jgi:hypothetical protein
MICLQIVESVGEFSATQGAAANQNIEKSAASPLIEIIQRGNECAA